MNRSNGVVLYVDHQGHPAPITECFIATAGHQLASRVRRYPSSILETMESAYCPTCLDQNFYDSLAAVDQQGGYCPTCIQCPNCFANLSVQAVSEENKGQFKYQCGRCDYSYTDAAATSVQALQEIVKQRRHDRFASFSGLMEYATSKWTTKSNSAPRSPQATDSPDRSWSLELLEIKTNTFKQKIEAKHSAELDSTTSVQRISIQQLLTDETLSADGTDSIMRATSDAVTTERAAEQMQPPQSTRLPLRTHLLVRRSLRCRAELAEGRPGILLKPKLSPLEGDSCAGLSSNTSSQWHRKDSSAIHIVPRIRFVDTKKLEPNQDGVVWYCGLLLIVNPTLGMVRVHIATSKYQGENGKHWDSFHDDQQSRVISNVLVDSLRQQYQDIPIPTPETTDRLRCPDEVIELKSAEDAMFHGAFSNASFLMSSIPDKWPEEPVGRVVATKGHVALIQVASPAPVAVASLSIVDIGQGSWESSLLRNREKVTFDLVLGFTEA